MELQSFQADRLGFTISWAANVPVVVEACTDLTHPVWAPVATNSQTAGVSTFSHPQWTPDCYSRLRSP